MTATKSEKRADRAQYESHAARLAARWFWLVPLSFYVLTASRTPGWVDAPLIAKVVHRLELSVWVNNHNLFTLVGHGWLLLTPRSVDPHYALNLLCAVLGAMTVYVVFRIGLRLTHNPFASMLGSVVLMVSHSLWWHSTMLEVYTLSTLLLATIVLFVVRYEQSGRFPDLCIAAFAYGLACSNHPQMGLLGVGFLGLLVWAAARGRRFRLKALSLLALFFLAGFQVYLWAFALELIERVQWATEVETLGVILQTMFDRASGGGFKRYMFPPGLSAEDRLFWWAFYLGLFVYSLPPPWILLAPVGLMAWWRKKADRASFTFFLSAMLLQIAWSANYLVWDMYAFALPAYVMTGILIVVGIDWLCRRGDPHRALVYGLAPTVLLVPLLYAKTPLWLARSERAQTALRMLPQYTQATAFWNPLDYFFDPNKRSYDRVERYATEILGRLEPDACFWGNEATMLYPLWFYYQDVLSKRGDVSYHQVFGILGSESKFAYQADVLKSQLDAGCPVYVSSLGYPERNVLNHVYHRLDDAVSLGEIARLSEPMFRETFPKYRLSALSVDPSEGVRIYMLQRR